jgi:hypothetical protein
MKESQLFDEVDGNTWSILVARCRLLWTIAIRDSIMAISKDLIYTVGFMKSQQRQSQLLSSGGTSVEITVENEFDEVSTASLSRVTGEHKSQHRSMLDYLLDERFDGDSSRQENSEASASNDADVLEQNPTIPTLDIHFSNPQVQLHSIATGGSIIVAMESADVEARKFVYLLVASLRSKAGHICPSDLLIKTG